MNILLCGSSGFIGRHLHQALTRAGHTVIGTRSSSRSRTAQQEIAVDFTRDTSPADWIPRLQGVDVVVNAVGVLRDTKARPIDAIHRATPCALFDACVQAQVKQVIQISALGIDGNPTTYAQSKLAAERHLMQVGRTSQMQTHTLRPSIVFGQGGASSALFMQLAKLPVLFLPDAALSTQVQPLSVSDLAEGVVKLVNQATPGLPQDAPILNCVGPRPLTLAEFIASLRQQSRRPHATVFKLPHRLTQWSATLGDHVPLMPWCTETLTLLSQDNTAPDEPFAQVLGRPATDPAHFLETSWH